MPVLGGNAVLRPRPTGLLPLASSEGGERIRRTAGPAKHGPEPLPARQDGGSLSNMGRVPSDWSKPLPCFARRPAGAGRA